MEREENIEKMKGAEQGERERERERESDRGESIRYI
jgi:hypothetical protein